MRPIVRLILALVLLPSVARADAPAPATAAAGGVAAPATVPARPTRVLFVGNSYTAFNGSIPTILKSLADHAGIPFEAQGSLMGGKSLEWHYEQGKARAAIAKGGWDYVVLQDFSTQAIAKPEKLAEYARKLDAEIDQVGARTVFYITWARQHQPEKQPVIAKAYQDAASDAGAVIAPVGLAWQRAVAEREGLILHFEDKSHPNPAGSYLTACVFYQVLLNRPPPEFVPSIKNQRTGQMDQLDAELAQFLRGVAAETVAAAPATSPTSRPAPAGVADQGR